MKRFMQMFEDQAGNLDEKRVLGILVAVGGMVFAFINPQSTATFIAIEGFAATLLGLSVAGDQGKLQADRVTAYPVTPTDTTSNVTYGK